MDACLATHETDSPVHVHLLLRCWHDSTCAGAALLLLLLLLVCAPESQCASLACQWRFGLCESAFLWLSRCMQSSFSALELVFRECAEIVDPLSLLVPQLRNVIMKKWRGASGEGGKPSCVQIRRFSTARDLGSHSIERERPPHWSHCNLIIATNAPFTMIQAPTHLSRPHRRSPLVVRASSGGGTGRTVAIAGAGIGGLATAVGLHKVSVGVSHKEPCSNCKPPPNTQVSSCSLVCLWWCSSVPLSCGKRDLP